MKKALKIIGVRKTAVNRNIVIGCINRSADAEAAIASNMPIPWTRRQCDGVYRVEILRFAQLAKPVDSSRKCPATHAGNSQTA